MHPTTHFCLPSGNGNGFSVIPGIPQVCVSCPLQHCGVNSPGQPVSSGVGCTPIQDIKINKDNKEAFLMCLLGYTAYNRIPNNVSKVTGASKEVVCGEIYEWRYF